MRQGQQNKRLRGRNRKGPNPLTRSYESNGPDVKIRGTALHIAEKYSQLARDAQSSGDRVMEQRYLQHAEHYYRIVAAAQAQMTPNMPQFNAQPMGRDDDDSDDTGPTEQRMNGPAPARHAGEGDQPRFGPGDPQPFVNGGGRDHDRDQEDGDELEAGEAGEDDGGESQPGGPGSGQRRSRRRSNRGRGRREGDDQQVRQEAAGETVGGDD